MNKLKKSVKPIVLDPALPDMVAMLILQVAVVVVVRVLQVNLKQRLVTLHVQHAIQMHRIVAIHLVVHALQVFMAQLLAQIVRHAVQGNSKVVLKMV